MFTNLYGSVLIKNFCSTGAVHCFLGRLFNDDKPGRVEPANATKKNSKQTALRKQVTLWIMMFSHLSYKLQDTKLLHMDKRVFKCFMVICNSTAAVQCRALVTSTCKQNRQCLTIYNATNYVMFTREALQWKYKLNCYSYFTAALANDFLWQRLFHVTENIIWLQNIAQQVVKKLE